MGPQRGHFHFFITTDTKHIFVYLRPICNHFSVKSLFPGSLPIFLVGFECKLLDILQWVFNIYLYLVGGGIIQEGKTDVKTPVIKTNMPAFLPGVWNPVKAAGGGVGGCGWATHHSPAAVDRSQDQTAHACVHVLSGFLTEHLLRMLLNPSYWDISHKKLKAVCTCALRTLWASPGHLLLENIPNLKKEFHYKTRLLPMALKQTKNPIASHQRVFITASLNSI